MSPMVLFEAVWLESLASQSGLAKVVEGFGGSLCSPGGPGRPLKTPGRMGLFFWAWAWVWDPDSPAGPWERSWEALLEALGKAHLPRPQKSTKHSQSKWITLWGSYVIGEVWPAQ